MFGNQILKFEAQWSWWFWGKICTLIIRSADLDFSCSRSRVQKLGAIPGRRNDRSSRLPCHRIQAHPRESENKCFFHSLGWDQRCWELRQTELYKSLAFLITTFRVFNIREKFAIFALKQVLLIISYLQELFDYSPDNRLKLLDDNDKAFIAKMIAMDCPKSRICDEILKEKNIHLDPNDLHNLAQKSKSKDDDELQTAQTLLRKTYRM